MKFYKIFLTSLTIVISCCLICPVFADWVSGGVWSYGAITIQITGVHFQTITMITNITGQA